MNVHALSPSPAVVADLAFRGPTPSSLATGATVVVVPTAALSTAHKMFAQEAVYGVHAERPGQGAHSVPDIAKAGAPVVVIAALSTDKDDMLGVAEALALSGVSVRMLDLSGQLETHDLIAKGQPLSAALTSLRGRMPSRELLRRATPWGALRAAPTAARDMTDDQHEAVAGDDAPSSSPVASHERALALALEYARAGLKVIPVRADKIPVAGRDWEDKATADECTLRRMFARRDATMVGLPCGVNNLVVLDLDRKPGKADGVAAMRPVFEQIEAEEGPDFLAHVPVVLTPTGSGEHWYFQQLEDDGGRFGGSSGVLPPGVDVRGDGGFVVACGSDRGDGVYAPKAGKPTLLGALRSGAIPVIPDTLAKAIGRRRASSSGGGTSSAERMSEDDLRKALALIPNDPAFADREKWVRMCHAIHGASGGEDWGRDIWLGWSDQQPQSPGEPERVWDTLRPGDVRVGAGFIQKCLVERGHAAVAAAIDFGATEDGGNPPSKTGAGKARGSADLLVEIGQTADLFHGPDGDTFASMAESGRRETWRVRSEDFKAWLIGRYLDRTNRAPSRDALAAAVDTLSAIARHRGAQRQVYLRVANLGSGVYLDLCDDARQVVEIDSRGWRIVSDTPVNFLRPGPMQPLPLPARGGVLHDLRRFVNIQSDEHAVLVYAWLTAALRGLPPYPLIVLRGEQGCAKTSFSRMLRRLTDPNASPDRSMPKDGRDLFIAASNSHVLAFDNLSGMSPDLSDALCTLATGGAYAGRKLYSDGEETVLSASRPAILNGIATLTDRPDLASRAVELDLPPIPEGQRRGDAELWAGFLEALPGILGALLDALSAGLRNWDTAVADPDARLADFSRWGAACEPAFGVPAGLFKTAYSANREAAAVAGVTDDPVATALRMFMSDRTSWQGTATELLEKLDSVTAFGRRDPRSWPASPKALSEKLRRVAPPLRAVGLRIDDKRTRSHRLLVVYWMAGATAALAKPGTGGEDGPDIPFDDAEAVKADG